MWLKSHHWVNNPSSITERRLVLNAVRSRTETVRLFDVKYRDIDTGKLNTDCLPTLNSTSYQDEVIDDPYVDRYYPSKRLGEVRPYREEAVKWFTPKDDDFEDECSAELVKEVKEVKKPETMMVVGFNRSFEYKPDNYEPHCIDHMLSSYNRGKR